MSTDRRTDDDLRSWLRAGDPVAREADPSLDEVARWRRRTLAATPPRRRYVWWSAAAAAAVLTVALLLSPRPAATPPPSAPEPAVSTVGESSSEARQIRFATAEGTQIIWVLDPNLNL